MTRMRKTEKKTNGFGVHRVQALGRAAGVAGERFSRVVFGSNYSLTPFRSEKKPVSEKREMRLEGG